MKKPFLAFLLLLPFVVQAQTTNSAAGNLTAASASCLSTNCVSLRFYNNTAAATITLSGTWSATVQFELSGDFGNTWVSASTASSTSTGVTQFTPLGGYTNIRARVSSYVSGTVVVTIVASLQTSATTTIIGGGTASLPSTYNLTVSGTTITATSGIGLATVTGSDLAVVLNSAMTNAASVCGTFTFGPGDYNINSMTQETTDGWTASNLYYGIAIPANAGSANQYCQWIFEGSAPASVNAGAAAQTAGTIIDVTSAALTSCGTGNWCAAWWNRPDTTNHEGNDIIFKNITTRFPNNQRGNEAAFLMWEAATVDYYNVVATLNTTIGTTASPVISPAVAGSNRMIAFSSTMSGRNNWQRFVDTFAIGYDIGYDIESEHSMLYAASTQWCSNFAFYGRLGSYGSFSASLIFHPGVWEKVTDAEGINGITFGSFVAQGSRLDIIGYDIETLSTGSFTRSVNMTETNPGYTSGIITYSVVSSSGGTLIAETPPNSLFSSGGQNFQLVEGTNSPSLARTPAFDTFTRPTNATLGPAWTALGAGSVLSCSEGANGGLAIHSNAAISTLTGGGACVNAALAYNADQFSQATANAMDSSGVQLYVRGNVSGVNTHYTYQCTTASGQVLSKKVAGTGTNLATSATNCAANDVLELKVIGSTLYAYRNGALSLTATDTSITSGAPGLGTNAINTDSWINWTGGSVPLYDTNRSMYSLPEYAPTYNTLANCAAVGTAASPSVASCGAAAAGQFSCATNATGATCQVNTTAVDANSQIIVLESDTTTTGTRLGVTCNTSTTVNPATRLLASQTAGTGFVINLGTVTTNPACFSYWIIN